MITPIFITSLFYTGRSLVAPYLSYPLPNVPIVVEIHYNLGGYGFQDVVIQNPNGIGQILEPSDIKDSDT